MRMKDHLEAERWCRPECGWNCLLDLRVVCHRATLIIAEPFFVHSDLTTGVQIADLIAYCISWGLRFGRMTKTGTIGTETVRGSDLKASSQSDP